MRINDYLVQIATQITRRKLEEQANCFAAFAGARGRRWEQAVSADADVIGIDLGATQSLVGVVDAGFPILLEDGRESWMTRSVVYYAKHGTVVGGGGGGGLISNYLVMCAWAPAVYRRKWKWDSLAADWRLEKWGAPGYPAV